MKKLVYLHELDSVRTSNAGITHGLKCLFEEVVKNGNYVAVSMNQLADSKIFISAIQNKENYNHILELFEKGTIRISRYKTEDGIMRTPAQYMLQSLKRNIDEIENPKPDAKKVKDSFITSALPIKHEDVELMKIMRDAIKFSDPEYVRAKCQEIPLADNEKKKDEIVEYLCTYVSFILSISKMKFSGNPPKENKAFNFKTFMEELKYYDVDKWFADEKNIHDMYLNVLQKVDEENGETILALAGKYAAEKINNRSNWHNYFSQEDKENNAVKHFGNILSKEELLFAEMLVDLCYNYTVEESIENISLHYNRFEDKESLHADIKERILQYCQAIDKGIYCPRTEELTEYIPYPREEKRAAWDTSSRVIVEKASAGNAELYEANYREERKMWSRKLRRTILKNIGIAFFYIVIFCLSDIATGYIQEVISVLLSEQIANNPVFDVVLNVGVFVIFFAIVNSLLAKWIKLPDILESIQAILLSFKDTYVVGKIEEIVYRRKE